jgi:hypothetical protein
VNINLGICEEQDPRVEPHGCSNHRGPWFRQLDGRTASETPPPGTHRREVYHSAAILSGTDTFAIVLAEVLNLAWMIWLVVVAWRMPDSEAASPGR